MSTMPSAPWRCAVYQISPSRPGAASCGRDPAGSWITLVSNAYSVPTSCAWAQAAVQTRPTAAAIIRLRMTRVSAIRLSNREDTCRKPPGEPRRFAPDLLVHRREEVLVALGILHLVEQELHRIDGAHLHQDAAQDPHLRQLILADQQLFLARARLADVERGEDALVGNLAVEDDF